MRICPQCKSRKIELYIGGISGQFICKNCGYIGNLIIETDNSLKPLKGKK